MHALKIQKLNWKKGDFWGIGRLTWLIVCGVGCSGCNQPTVVPPTASISSPKQPSMSIPQPIEPMSPPSHYPIDPITSSNPWKPDAELRKWDYIVLHHTASETGNVESIHQEHLNRKDKNGNAWLGIGYHFVIGNGSGMGDGEVEPTFRWKQQLQGAHAGVANFNQHGIGVVLIGNFDRAAPTDAQTESVKRLVGILKREYGIVTSNVIGHGDLKATECPGKYFPLDQIRDSVAWNDHPAIKKLSNKFAANSGHLDLQQSIMPKVMNNGIRTVPSEGGVADVSLAWTNLPGDSRK
jgi:N-acetyl-anhydromuramyl-L-alanine amidase AmpD